MASPTQKVTVLVTGTRNLADTNAAWDAISEAFAVLGGYSVTLLHGGADGIDQMASKVAVACGWRIERFLPDYKKYGRSAPLVRNCQMVDKKPDVVLAFWDGESKGTKQTIEYARSRKVPVLIHKLELAEELPF